MRDLHHMTIELLEGVAAELAAIHRAKHYGLWRSEAEPRLSAALAERKPFNDFQKVLIHTGDGGGATVTPRFGGWAIDRLVEKMSPQAILAVFSAEVERNASDYQDVSPLFGVDIDARCDLDEGLAIVSEPEDVLASVLHRSPFQLQLPPKTAMLCHAFEVKPAFERVTETGPVRGGHSVTSPKSDDREAVRRRVRLACLLASRGPVELPLTILRPDHAALFVAGEGNSAERMFAAHPLVSFPVEAANVKRAFDQLGEFRQIDSLARGIDRLGRSRLASTDVDRALDLGMAAEIALMHGQDSSAAEIKYKVASRAAWLLEREPAERGAVFVEMKKFYDARSKAVHTGLLPSKSNVNLMAADLLVTRALSAILERGDFPDWDNLIMGGDESSSEVDS